MCVQIDFHAFGMFHANCAPILHQDLHYLQTDRTEQPLEPLHLGVPKSASKMVSQTMIHQVQTVHISCTETNNVSKWTEARFQMTHVTMEFHRVHPMFHANHAPTLHKDQHYLHTDRTKLSLEPLHPGVPNSVSKMVSQTMVHQAQIVHLSCTKTYNVYKRTEGRFLMTHVIQQYHWVCAN